MPATTPLRFGYWCPPVLFGDFFKQLSPGRDLLCQNNEEQFFFRKETRTRQRRTSSEYSDVKVPKNAARILNRVSSRAMILKQMFYFVKNLFLMLLA
jgi:hypothetical protein